MKLTFELEGAIAYLHPNHVDSERVVQSSAYLVVCIYLFVCFLCFGNVCVC